MPEVAVVVELDRPAVGLVDGFSRAGDRFIADDLDGGGFVADEFGEEGADDGMHAGGEDDDLL